MTRTLKILFTLSILLNIILIGLVAGGISRLYMHISPDRDFQKQLQALPQDVQTRIRDTFKESRGEMRELHKAMREARRGVRESLNADPFSRAEYDRAVTQLNQVRMQMMESRAQKTGLIVENLTPEDRRKFAGYLLRGGKRGGFEEAGERPEYAPQSHQKTPVSQEVTQAKRPKNDTAQGNRQKPEVSEPFNSVILPMPEFELE